MLSGRDEHAFLHQAGGVADASNVAPSRFHLEVVQVGAAKDDSSARWCGQDSKMDGSTAVKTDTCALYRRADCLFLLQGEGLYVQREYQITGSAKYLYVANLPHSVAGRKRSKKSVDAYLDANTADS